MERNDQPPTSPYPPSSSLLKDISNFRTPKRSSHLHNFTSPYTQFFTASKQTPKPSSSLRNSRPKHKTATARRLKAFELEQSQSSRKLQAKKEQSLKSLSKSLTTWLNFLFQNPRSCGCDLAVRSHDRDASLPGKPGAKRQRDIQWRSPKRMRSNGSLEIKGAEKFSYRKNYELLRNSLKDVCSFDDLKQRMRLYLNLDTCEEIFDIMSLVVKNIDEGRLKMKPHCPIVTDVGMKEKAIQTLMCYNPIWLRIGLHTIFGGDSLLPDGNVESNQEIAFLKMVIEKQFFSHAGLAKAYAYNKMVEGLYRPGYYEKLGSVILKRFLLLVIILDRAKSHSALSLKYGIDGVDGGSPLLFVAQSNIKSSRQMINDSLSSEIMLGEGNLLAHLVILGYKVSYQQCPLVEYDFRLTDLFTDLQDGVRLCRAIHLLRNDPSVLMKMLVPSDTRKKNLVNCGNAMQYLKISGVKLFDDDGIMITEDDVANGDKEITVSLLWNMFVHLQLPLLINSTILVEEILKILGTNVVLSESSNGSSSLELLLNWIQVVCNKYGYKVDNFSSLIDGKAVWCLLDYYFRKELSCSRSLKDPSSIRGEESIMSAADYADAVHNFILSQKLINLLGNFPEILQISDILEHCGPTSERSVIILLVFLASQLTAKKSMDQVNFHKLLCCNCQNSERRHSSIEQCGKNLNDVLDQVEMDDHCIADAGRKFQAIKAWWQDMAERNNHFVTKPETFTSQHSPTNKSGINNQKDNAAILIQSHFRRSIARCKFLTIKNSVLLLQTVIRAWFMVKQKSLPYGSSSDMVQKSTYGRWKQSERDRRYVKFIVERHSFVKLRRLVLFIQHAARMWMARKLQARSITNYDISTTALVNAAMVVQKYFRGWIARSRCRVILITKASNVCQVHRSNFETEAAILIQHSWKNYVARKSLHSQHLAASKIQCHFRCWQLRRKFLKRKELIINVQRCYRAWLIRRNFITQKEAAMKIQNAIRCIKCWRTYHCSKNAAIEIQRFMRGQITRKRLLGATHFTKAIGSCGNFRTSVRLFCSFELKIILSSIVKLQRWWRGILLLRQRKKSAIVIQSCVRSWIGRRRISMERRYATMIQSHWKGYLVRKESRGQLLDLRLRVQKSAKNVDDSRRIINRLKTALSELLSMKSMSGILHTCSTLDMTTEHSQKCCEELVAAGAIEILLELIHSVSRSIPDQEVLKHALSTIRNLNRYQHLTEVLIDSHKSIEIIFREFLRNKEEGYFIASEILRKICSKKKGVQSLRKLPALLKRLHNLVEELTRKSIIEKRNPQSVAAREKTERRLREAAGLLKLMAIN